jgi:hypothetical protein
MDPAQSSGDGRRRGKKNRGKHGRRKRSSRGNRGHTRQQKEQRYTPADSGGDDSSILGRRVPVQREQQRGPREPQQLTPFNLFCAYHLGVTPDDRYHEPRMDEVARRFGISHDEVRKQLQTFGLDEATIKATGFDLAGAKLDIKLAPEGISRLESARDLFQEYLDMRGEEPEADAATGS